MTILNMGNKIAGHILSKSFYDNMKDFMEFQALSALHYNRLSAAVDTLLQNQTTQTPYGQILIASNPSQPQIVYESAHDELLRLVDARVFHLAHMVKINNFMPHVVSKFGSDFLFTDTVEDGVALPEKGEWEGNIYCRYNFEQASDARRNPQTEVISTVNINLEAYTDLDKIADDTAQLFEDGYNRLYQLRKFMSPDTLKRRENDRTRDEFCTIFLNGKETTTEYFRSRTEYQYFKQMSVNLGIFDTAPAVAKWLAEARRKPSTYERAIDCLKDKDKGLMLPGVMLKDTSGQALNLSMIERQLARDFKGPIPKEGILLGHATKPPSGKPRLVL